MKKTIAVVIGLVLIISLTSCFRRGVTRNAVMEIGESEKFAEEEIEAAMAVVIDYFPNFEGCELVRLWYDEEYSDRKLSHESRLLEAYGKENLILLLSDFDEDGFDYLSTEHTMYYEWEWLLAREDELAEWEIISYGYC